MDIQIDQSFTWLPLPIREALRKGGESGDVYLVGGAVRDIILGQKCRDYDFVLGGKIKLIARRVADYLGGDFYPLDEDRQMMRVLWYPDAREVVTLDFSPFQGGTLNADLQNRDFTINAMAVNPADPDRMIDPLKGVMDLKNRVLRRCREGSILDDPVRAIRAVRIAVQLELAIEQETAGEVRQAGSRLDSISVERIRDELFRLLGGRQVCTAVRLLDTLGLLTELLPEITQLKGVEQNSAHSLDVYEHSLASLFRLEGVFDLLKGRSEDEIIQNLTSAQVMGVIRPYRSMISDHLQERIADERTRRGILFFAVLFHDAGKAVTSHRGPDGEIHSYGHETKGARIATKRTKALNCSNRESEIIEKIVKGHMRPNLLRKSPQKATPKAIYRFFRDHGEEGVDICLFSLADMLAKRAGPPDQADWLGLLEVNRQLLDAWYNHREERVNPPKLIDGNDLMKVLSIPPGPAVGKALVAITEAQVEGKVHSREDAVEFIQRHKSF